LRALALAGASPEEAVHVGDSLEEDVLGARAAGIEPILIRRDGGGGAVVRGGAGAGAGVGAGAGAAVRTIASLAELG
jgi:putative hydrolase of the HAD superfamily